MKTTFILTAVVAVLIFLDCTVQESSSAVSPVGAWRNVKASWTIPDTTFVWDVPDSVSITKVYSNSYVSFIRRYASGKTQSYHFSAYDITDDTYTEHIKVHSDESMIGTDWVAKITLTDSLMTITNQPSDTSTYYEEWKRID